MVRIKRVKRIAVAVKDLDAAVENWKKLFGIIPFQKGEEPEDKYAYVAFQIGNAFGEGEMTIEFLSPINDPDGEMIIGSFIKNRGEGLYMITLETEGTSDEVDQELEETGLKPAWEGQLKHWEPIEELGMKSWTEHYISPMDANGVLITLASIVYARPFLNAEPGVTLRKKSG
ncbi:MAG: hypothetical protein GY849_23010 [Deltaproteobacteria bacterium]|nr:hypothetical protein [Deltaproteobacteria bacterium]